MAKSYFAWWEVNDHFFQIKFVSTIDVATFINDNFVLYNDAASPTTIVDPFEDIVVAKDYSSVSRILTLWWKNPPASGAYTLHVNNLKTFLGEYIGNFSIPFNWVLDSATPESGSTEELLRPDRVPVEVEDYSIKTPGWSIIESPAPSVISGLDIIDLAPGTSIHHNISAQENEGRIDIMFSAPIATNFITPIYFALSSKPVKRGLSTWTAVDTYVTSNADSTIVSIYLPGKAIVESATPESTVYSHLRDISELDNYIFFEPQTKYRLIVSTDVGKP
jgi:hypothetical protein